MQLIRREVCSDRGERSFPIHSFKVKAMRMTRSGASAINERLNPMLRPIRKVSGITLTEVASN